MKTRLLILIILVCVVLVGTFLVNFLFLEKSNIEKQIILPDDFGEEKLRWTCSIGGKNDLLNIMSGDNGQEILCPVDCEVVKNTCVYPLPKDEIVRELQKGSQGLTFAESKFVMNIVKSDPKVKEIIGNRGYTEFCCAYMYEAGKNPNYILGATLELHDNNESISVAINSTTMKIIKIETSDTWHSSSGEEILDERISGIPLRGLSVIDNAEMQSMIDLFENRYDTSQRTFVGPYVILNATNVWGETISLVMQSLNDKINATLTCNHMDWRNQEVITENILDYLQNKNCFTPALEETRK